MKQLEGKQEMNVTKVKQHSFYFGDPRCDH